MSYSSIESDKDKDSREKSSCEDMIGDTPTTTLITTLLSSLIQISL